MTGEAEERKSFHDVPTKKKGAPAKKVARSAEISVFALPEAGLEPARGNAPWDFKSHVSTSSTTPACGQIVGEGLLSRNILPCSEGCHGAARGASYPTSSSFFRPSASYMTLAGTLP